MATPSLTEFLVPDPLKPYMPLVEGVVTALLILALGWVVSKWAYALVVKVLRKRAKDETLLRFVAAFAQYFVLAATVIAALARVGVETISLVALLGSAGLAVGLALQGSLSHFASGVLVLLFRPFAVGDSIEAAGHAGTVSEVGLFATVLTTAENHRVIVPNGAIMSGPVTNCTVLGKRRARFAINIAYGSDVGQVSELILEAAKSVEGILLDDPNPSVLFMGFGGGGLEFAVNVWAVNDSFWGMQPKVRRAIYEQLNAAGIEVAMNQIIVHQAK